MEPFTGQETWSLGTLAWTFIAFPILMVILTVVGVVATRHFWRDEHGDGGFVALISFALGACLIIGTAWAMWPYDTDFHKWREIRGRVEAVNDRLIREGEGVSQRFVVTIAGRPFGCDDTRCATVRPGDIIALNCKKEWQYAAESGEACRWLGDAGP